MTEINIYPSIQVNENQISYEISTYIRKPYRGKYYFWVIRENTFWDERHTEKQKTQDRLDVHKRFHKQVYSVIILGKVNPKLRATDNTTIFKTDSDIRTEEQRLIDLYNG